MDHRHQRCASIFLSLFILIREQLQSTKKTDLQMIFIYLQSYVKVLGSTWVGYVKKSYAM